MGRSKETVVQNTTQVSQPTESAYEREVNPLEVERRRAQQQGLLESDQASLALGNAFMRGQELPGYFKNLPYGISPEVTTGIVDSSLRDLNTQLRKSGAGTFLESGAAQSIGARTAGEIRQNAEQFNLGQLLNLLNLSIGAPAQIQQPINQNASIFSSRLAGLRGNTTTGSGSATSYGMNPFLKSFQTSAGSSLGSGVFGAMKFGA